MKRKAVLTFMRAPKPCDTITINNCATITVRCDRHRPKLDPRIYGFVAVIPPRELAYESCLDIVQVINRHPEKFGVTASAHQWRVILEPIIICNKGK